MPIVNDYTALLSGYSWNGMTNPGAPVFVSYAFLKNSEVPSLADYQPYANDGYSAFTNAQKASFRKAIKEFEKISGIRFVEVDDPADASIDVMNTSGSDYGGWANYGIGETNYTTDGYLVIDNSGNYAPGTYAFETILHELGHTAGLKHPFDGKKNLPANLDNDDYTLMSYTSNGVADTEMAPFDKDALQYLYGKKGAVRDSWNWSWSNAKSEFKLTGSNKKDVLIGLDTDSIIKGRGGNDTIIGRDLDDKIFGGDGKDVIDGGNGNNVLRGGNGDDVFIDNWGNDVFNGGSGSDTVDFSHQIYNIWLDLSAGTVFSTGYGTNSFISIENANGGTGDDRMTGNGGANRFEGNKGKDILIGNGGKDKLFGGKGKDELNGGYGKDRLSGEGGNDKLTGGAGKDKFVFRDKDDKDKIFDFQNNVDTILLDDNLWNNNKSVSQVLNQFGTQVGSNFVLDFGGGDILTILNATKSQLQDDISIV